VLHVDQDVTSAMVGLAAGLGLDTIAEGVETPQQAQLLAEQGWQMGQSLLFGVAAEMSVLDSA
jgi:EAL domain-containing protein (putative c-di-GMP-specific phosphodiesterase class I)